MKTLDMINLANSIMPKVVARLSEELENYTGDLSMLQMVTQDAADQLRVLELLSEADRSEALRVLEQMDTEPREEVYHMLAEAGAVAIFEDAFYEEETV